MFAQVPGALRALVVVAIAALASSTAAFAQSATPPLTGTVLYQAAPVPDAVVTATGSNRSVQAHTDAKGRFRFNALPIGSYTLSATAPQGKGTLNLDLTSSGADVIMSLGPLQQIGRTAVTSRPPVGGSGTDVALNSQFLNRAPSSGSLPNLLIQLPGAARGANGVVHINGDHGDVNYIVDGVAVPQELNRVVGGEFDPNDIAFIEALQGAYPAQYGERFAAVININTRVAAGPAGFQGNVGGGSYAGANATLTYHTPLGRGSLIVSSSNARTGRGLDPPNFDSPHNDSSNVNQFLRYTAPLGQNFLNWTLSRSYQTFQIPNDVAAGEPANTDDNETQEDLFTTLQFRHPIGDHGSWSVGPSYKRSRIRDFGDPANDFVYGMALNPGAPTDCANALSSWGTVANGVVQTPIANPNVNYVNGSCAYSLFGDSTAIDVGGNFDYVNHSAKHGVAFGAYYDATHVGKNYNVTLQPDNFLAPIFMPSTPGASYTVTDADPNVGHLTALYLQDSWKMGAAYQLDYGVRTDSFSVASPQFAVGFGQVSPRIKLTRSFGARDSVYAFYGRFFTPFSLQNVAPLAAYTLNLPLQPVPVQYDLKPQRDSDYELGAHLAMGRGDLGLRVMQKNATDLIDDTQVGVTNLHQDINYLLGRIATQTAYYQYPLARSGRFYLSATHTYSVNKGCETQLLAPCFGSPTDWTPADHDQRVDVTSGILLNDTHGGWWSFDSEYGSGLSTSLNPQGGITCAGPDYAESVGGPCKRTPHLTFDAVKGIGLGHGAALTLSVHNLFNDRYMVTYRNAQGNHFAPPRTFSLDYSFGQAR